MTKQQRIKEVFRYEKYNTPEIETLSLEMIDVITASIPGGGTVDEQLNNAGLTEDQITEINESLDAMLQDKWGW